MAKDLTLCSPILPAIIKKPEHKRLTPIQERGLTLPQPGEAAILMKSKPNPRTEHPDAWRQ